MAKDRDKFIQNELQIVEKEWSRMEGSQLHTCLEALVAITIKKTSFKCLLMRMQFPVNYPQEAVIIELSSKTLSDKLLDGLQKVCDEESKKYLNQPQVGNMINFVSRFLDENNLCVCSSEISEIKRNMLEECDEIKLRQKASQIIIKAHQENYFLHFKVSVPIDYPKTQVGVDFVEYNFPELLKINFLAQANEYARQCVQPPLRKKPNDPPFQAKPSLLPICKFLIVDCVKNYPLQKCPICCEYVLPKGPVKECTRDKQVERVYCGHLYHHSCLATYMKTPPFIGGKKCPACNQRIFHEKWKITPELAEARWAHKQARERELDEVKDFMA
ncbi:uncharacterized protein LOC115232497 [Octopus sinensis]|uniref:Uncharacterized protein LOC115232497 n=1 Tax=Octopus sinensis TaxID=2607531 RepID=A0A6P7U0N4_9MOLL|nr:uncharacterized protein LOC115232497 [Octopus sinensis]